MPAFLKTFAATAPHGAVGTQTATLTDAFARSASEVTLAGLLGGVTTSAVLLTKFCGPEASPALTTASMFFGEAEAKTSAGAPLVIWVDSVPLEPKLKVTLSPGWAASKFLPIVVKGIVSDEAANTVIDPVGVAEAAGELADVFDEPDEPLLPQAARATATVPAAAMTANLRITELLIGSGFSRGGASWVRVVPRRRWWP